VKRFWRGKHEGLDLERELRANRPEPRSEFVHALEARVREDGRRSRGGLRIAFVGALTACMLFALASVGGLGYAASAVGDVGVTAKRIVKKKGPTIVKKSSAASQYSKPTKKKVKKKVKAKKKVKVKRRSACILRGRVVRPCVRGKG
jgi:hypothetical protein